MNPGIRGFNDYAPAGYHLKINENHEPFWARDSNESDEHWYNFENICGMVFWHHVFVSEWMEKENLLTKELRQLVRDYIPTGTIDSHLSHWIARKFHTSRDRPSVRIHSMGCTVSNGLTLESYVGEIVYWDGIFNPKPDHSYWSYWPASVLDRGERTFTLLFTLPGKPGYGFCHYEGWQSEISVFIAPTRRLLAAYLQLLRSEDRRIHFQLPSPLLLSKLPDYARKKHFS